MGFEELDGPSSNGDPVASDRCRLVVRFRSVDGRDSGDIDLGEMPEGDFEISGIWQPGAPPILGVFEIPKEG